MDDTLWNHVEGAKSKRPGLASDAPTQQSMRAGIKPAQQKAPSGDQKRVRRQMAKSASTASCAVPGDNHSDDLIEVFSGSVEPTVLCGFHAQESMIGDSLKQSKTATKESNMTEQHTEASLLQAMASAQTMTEQSHYGELLRNLREARSDAIAREGSLDWGSMGAIDLTPTFAPVITTSAALGSTAGNLDWLADIAPDTHDDASVSSTMRAEATLWFEALWDEVKKDSEEFQIQAHNAARRTASQFGLQREGAASMFVETATHLHKKAGFKPTASEVQDPPYSQENGSKLDNPSNDQTFDGLQTDLSGEGDDPKTSPSDSASLKEGDQPEGDQSASGNPPIKDTDRGTYDQSTRDSDFVDSLPSGGTGTATGSVRIAWLDEARNVLANHQHQEVDGVLLDAFSASAMVQIHDGLSGDNQAKFAAMPVTQAHSVAMKILNKTSARRTAAWSKGDRVERDGKTYEVTSVTPAGSAGTSEADGPKYHLKPVVDGKVLPAGQGVTLDVWSKSTSNPTSAFTKASSRKTADGPTHTFPCGRCGTTVERWRGESDVYCPSCGTPHNAGGQQLRDDFASNPSMYDDNIGDMEGFEMQHAHGSRQPNLFEAMRRALATEDPKISPSDSPSLQEGDTPEGSKSEPLVEPASKYPSDGSLDASTWGGDPDSLSNGGTGNAATSGPMSGTPTTSSRKVAIDLKNVGIVDKAGLVCKGTDPSGKEVKFKVTQKEMSDLSTVLHSDLAINFSGVSIEESDIVKDASRTASEYQGGSPKAGDTATCHADGKKIEFFSGAWYHLKGGPSHNDVYPASKKDASRHEADSGIVREVTDKAYRGRCPKCNIALWEGNKHNCKSASHKQAKDTSHCLECGGETYWNGSRFLHSDSDKDHSVETPTQDQRTSSRKQAGPLGPLDRSVVWTLLLNYYPGFGQMTHDQTDPITTAAVAAWGESDATDMHEFILGWINQQKEGGRRQASEGMTCSVCGDKIAKDPSGEDPSTYHHDNGEKHDHEAKPSGESKESSRRTALNSADIVGYTFRAEQYCPGCIIGQVTSNPGDMGHSGPNHDTDSARSEQVLAVPARLKGINREDESSFDSNQFPKVIFADQASGENCGLCHNPLV